MHTYNLFNIIGITMIRLGFIQNIFYCIEIFAKGMQ